MSSCFVTTDILCRQSRVPISKVQLANRAIYMYDNRDPINQGHVFFFVFHFGLTTFSEGESQTFQLYLPFSTGKNNGSTKLLCQLIK